MDNYQVEVEDIEYCKVKVKYKAIPSVVASKTQEVIKSLRHLPVPGNRPGKASDLAIALQYRKQIDQLTKESMLRHANDDIIFETKMKIVGAPVVEDATLEGNNFSCQLMYMKKPDFELKQYKGFEIPKPVTASLDDVREKVLQQLKMQFGDAKPFDENDFVQQGDKITMDYSVGDTIKKEGELYLVGSNIVPELDQNIYGMSVGETREFDVTVNGETAKCTVTLNMGLKATPCPEEDLHNRMNIETHEKLMEEVRGFAENQVKAQERSLLLNQYQKRLLAEHDFKVPEWFEVMEAQTLAMNHKLNWEALPNDDKERLRTIGRDNVKLAFIIDSIVDAEPEVNLSTTEIMQGIGAFLQRNGVKDVNAWFKENQNSPNLHALVARYKTDNTLDWLLKQVKVVE